MPFAFSAFAQRIELVVDEPAQLSDPMRQETEQRNEWILDNLYRIIADSRHTLLPPEKQAPVPYLDFAPLRNAIVRLGTAARR